MCDLDRSADDVQIDRCPHGTYHLTVGNTTLHLSAQGLQNIAHGLLSAMQHHADQITADATQERRKRTVRDRFRDGWLN